MKIWVGEHLVTLEEFMDSLDELIEMGVIEIHNGENGDWHFFIIDEKRILN